MDPASLDPARHNTRLITEILGRLGIDESPACVRELMRNAVDLNRVVLVGLVPVTTDHSPQTILVVSALVVMAAGVYDYPFLAASQCFIRRPPIVLHLHDLYHAAVAALEGLERSDGQAEVEAEMEAALQRALAGILEALDGVRPAGGGFNALAAGIGMVRRFTARLKEA